MNKITRVYQDLIDIAKEHGLRIYHKKLPNTGRISYKEKWIEIDPSLKNTKRGCYILAHELAHYADYNDKKFRAYHHEGKYANTPMPISYIRRMEWSATMLGKKLVEISGLKIGDFPDFNKKIFENDEDFMPWWIEYYNYIRLGKKYEKTKK